MDDLISRQAAIDEIRKCRFVVDAIEKIRGLPSAQPEPIKINIEDFNKEDWERLKKEWGNTPITVLSAQPEIICCKDCKYFETAGNLLDGLCRRHRIPTTMYSTASVAEQKGEPMSDCMTFPDTVEEFMEQYKIVDTEQVYTNGTELVPIFRMKQWFKHLPSAQPERKVGKWHITDAFPHNVYCPVCHKKFAQTHWAVWEDGSLPRNYCPNCGAYMGGDT